MLIYWLFTCISVIDSNTQKYEQEFKEYFLECFQQGKNKKYIKYLRKLLVLLSINESQTMLTKLSSLFKMLVNVINGSITIDYNPFHLVIKYPIK